MQDPILKVSGLSVSFNTTEGRLDAVRGVDLDALPGETVALVGESGCGKTVTALALMGLVPPPGNIDAGSIIFEGRELLELSSAEMRKIRGAAMAMIFQEPMTSLNPVFTAGSQIVEALQAHESVNTKDGRKRVLELLRLVKIPEPEQRFRQYPHQLSGGMQQRVMIAMALACRPVMLIADEPTTALDVTVQAEILNLLENLKNQLGMAMLIITHDLGVVAETTDRVFVMYAGRIVEAVKSAGLFERPMHPYTAGLLAAVPRIDTEGGDLQPIPGAVPNLMSIPQGCPFHPRCHLAEIVCEREEPPLKKVADGHLSACHFAESVKCPITKSSS